MANQTFVKVSEGVRSLACHSLAGGLRLSGALGVGVVAARGVLPVGLVVPVLRSPPHCSFSENKSRRFIFRRCFRQTSGIWLRWGVQYISIHL